MPDPISFTNTSPRHGLPFLFVGQAQKEYFVNEALARLDALLHPAVEDELSNPPASPEDGQCWVVGASATGEWAGHDAAIACWQAGNWFFQTPQVGMQLFDKAAGRLARFDGSWVRADAVTAPDGGSTVDNEARTAIAGLISALVAAGILA